MKKISFIALVALCFGITKSYAVTENVKTPEVVEVYTFDFKNNFYLGVNGGVQALINGPKSENFSKNLCPSFNIYGGVDFNPIWGLRLQLGYTNQKAYIGDWPSTFSNSSEYGSDFKVNMLNAELDATLNLTNAICGSKGASDRVFNFYAFAGLGEYHAMAKSTNSDDLYLALGLYGTARVASHWYVTAEVSDRLSRSSILGYYNAHPTYNFIGARLGLMYKFGDKGYKKYSNQSSLDLIEAQRLDLEKKAQELAAMESELARVKGAMDAKNNDLERLLKEKGLAAVPELPIFFGLNSTEVDQKSKYILQEYCDCIKQLDSDYQIQVTGYADLATGTRSGNEALKVKRAVKVADIISQEYGIPASNIMAEGGDLDNSPYADNKPFYSRVAIVKFVKK